MPERRRPHRRSRRSYKRPPNADPNSEPNPYRDGDPEIATESTATPEGFSGDEGGDGGGSGSEGGGGDNESTEGPGPGDLQPGNIAANLQSASEFLAEQKQIPEAAPLKTFQDAIYTKGLPDALKQ